MYKVKYEKLDLQIRDTYLLSMLSACGYDCK